MAKITQFNKANLSTIRQDVDAALAAVAAKHGIELKIGNIKFSAQTFRTQMEAAVVAADGNVMTREARNWSYYGATEGMKTEWLFKEFTDARNVKHRIVGYNARSSKRPVMTDGSDGKHYAFPPEHVVYYMKSAGA